MDSIKFSERGMNIFLYYNPRIVVPDRAHNYLQKYLEGSCMFYYLHPIVFLEMDKDIFLLEQF